MLLNDQIFKNYLWNDVSKLLWCKWPTKTRPLMRWASGSQLNTSVKLSAIWLLYLLLTSFSNPYIWFMFSDSWFPVKSIRGKNKDIKIRINKSFGAKKIFLCTKICKRDLLVSTSCTTQINLLGYMNRSVSAATHLPRDIKKWSG